MELMIKGGNKTQLFELTQTVGRPTSLPENENQLYFPRTANCTFNKARPVISGLFCLQVMSAQIEDLTLSD